VAQGLLVNNNRQYQKSRKDNPMSTLPKSAFQMLPLSRLHESPTNPRRVFDEAQLQELADFVSGHKIGLLFRSPFCGR
jgi:hypothetical protein